MLSHNSYRADDHQNGEMRARGDGENLPVDGGESSFPAAEEMRISNAGTSTFGNTSKRKKLCLGGSVALIALIVMIALLSSSNDARVAHPSLESVIAYLVKEEIVSSPSVYADKSSPQYRAAKWLATEDEAILPVPSHTTTKLDGYFYIFRYVMAVSYYALDGDEWNLNLDFLSNKTVCGWNHASYGVVCKQVNGAVVPVKLVLRKNRLKGQIPSEIGFLTTLQQLDFGNNDLIGSIPSNLCSLVQMDKLIFNNNLLLGPIPTCLGAMSTLTTIALSNNKLTGSLPIELGNLTNLKNLYLDNNELVSDPTPVFNELTNLQNLFASKNTFTGNIDLAFAVDLTQIHRMDLSHNRFTSAAGFPRHLLESTLEFLDLSKNQLTGVLPTMIMENSSLRFLSLYENQISGSLACLANLKLLIHLDLSNNILSGAMDPIGAVSTLAVIFLSENQFEAGSIPSSFSNLTGLVELSLRNTNRIGKLPELPSKIQLLDLGSNRLTGSIPESYGNCTGLTYLLLRNNSAINGSIPSSFANLKGLRGAFLDGTSLDNTTMDKMCDMYHFLSVEPDFDEVLVGNCVNCRCSGCQCCATDNTECYRSILDNLDLSWEGKYRSSSGYSLWNISVDTPPT